MLHTSLSLLAGSTLVAAIQGIDFNVDDPSKQGPPLISKPRPSIGALSILQYATLVNLVDA